MRRVVLHTKQAIRSTITLVYTSPKGMHHLEDRERWTHGQNPLVFGLASWVGEQPKDPPQIAGEAMFAF